MYSNKTLTLLLLLLLPLFGEGQNLLLSGKIVDAETGEPLPFASIGIKGESIGTVSNLNGEFDFYFPSEYVNQKIIISMLGYIDLSGNISTLLGRDTLTFKMRKAAQLLKEVVVKDSLSAKEVMQIAINRISLNFPDQPYMLDGFYRDLKKIGGTYFSLLEAAIKIHDENYSAPKNKYRLRERVSLIEVRKSLGYDHKFTRFFDQANLLEDLLLHNPIKYRHFPDEEGFYESLKRLPNTYYNGRQVFVIKQTHGPKLKVYIDTDSYAFLRIENEIIYDDLVIKKSKDLYSKFKRKKLVLDFKEYKDTMYPEYLQVISQINWYDENDSLQFETELYQELMINDITLNPDDRLTGVRKMKKYGLQYQDLPYNQSFWDNYNVIKQTPLDEGIIADLEAQGALPEKVKDY